MLEKVLEKIFLPNTKEIRGNLTLQDCVEGYAVSWKSSRPEVISDKDEGKCKAGKVTRQEKDVSVTLTATVSDGQESAFREWSVTVLAAPKKLTDDDFTGYLFGHFIGEEGESGEQIYFALSEDGLNFKDLSPKAPVLVSKIGEKGVRDPYLCRSAEGDRFFLIATDLSIYHRGGWFQNAQGYYDASTTGSPYLVLWESSNLVNWGEAKLLKVAPENAGMAWAPEMVYDEQTGSYVIFFSSSIMNPITKYKAKPNAIYYVTTRDFVHLSETKLFIDNQTDGTENGKPREIIDTTVLRVGEFFYSASKDGDNAEKNGGIRIMKNKNLLDANGWEKVLDLDELLLDTSELSGERLDNGFLEGPELFRYNKKDWADKNVPEYGLMADQYMLGAGYLPLTTTDLEDTKNARGSWKLLKKGDYSFDLLKKRHGTILPLTEEEVKRLKEKFL